MGELKQRLDDLRGQAERAQRDADFETASRIMYGQIPALEAELAAAAADAGEDTGKATAAGTAAGHAAAPSASSGAGPDSGPMVKEEVGPDDVADVVASWTGIPAGRAACDLRPLVIENLRAIAAWASVAHLPEVLLKRHNPRVG